MGRPDPQIKGETYLCFSKVFPLEGEQERVSPTAPIVLSGCAQPFPNQLTIEPQAWVRERWVLSLLLLFDMDLLITQTIWEVVLLSPRLTGEGLALAPPQAMPPPSGSVAHSGTVVLFKGHLLVPSMLMKWHLLSCSAS